MGRRRRERRLRRGPGGRLGRVSLLLSMVGLIVVVVFVVSRVVTDRFGWSQWLWWVPGVWYVVLGWGVLFLSVVAGWLSRRRGRRRRGLVLKGVVLAGCVGMVLGVVFGGLQGNGGWGWDWAQGERENTVRAMHWNVSAGEIDVERTMEWIQESNVDVVLIANPRWDGQRQELVDGMEGIVGEGGTVRRLGRGVVMSRFDLVGVSMVYVSASGGEGAGEDAMRATGDFGWVAMLSFDRGEGVGVEERFFDVWFVDLPSEPTVHRMGSMGRVAELLEERAKGARPALIIGDFNTVRGSASLGLFDVFEGGDGFVDAYGDRGGGLWGGSWKPIGPGGIGGWIVGWTSWGIDLSLVGNGWGVVGYELLVPDGGVWGGGDLGVSHRAQVVDIKWIEE